VTNLVSKYSFLFLIMTIFVTNNFLFCKLVIKLVTIVTNNFLSLKFVINETFSYNEMSILKDIKLDKVGIHRPIV